MSFCVMTAYAKIDAYFTVLFKSCGFKGFFLAYSCAVEKLSLIFIRLIYRGGNSDKMLLLIRRNLLR